MLCTAVQDIYKNLIILYKCVVSLKKIEDTSVMCAVNVIIYVHGHAC